MHTRHDLSAQLPPSHSRRHDALTACLGGTAVYYSRACHYRSLRVPVICSSCMRYLLLTLCCPIPGQDCSAFPLCVSPPFSPPSPSPHEATRHIARPRRHPTPHLLMVHRTHTKHGHYWAACSGTRESRGSWAERQLQCKHSKDRFANPYLHLPG